MSISRGDVTFQARKSLVQLLEPLSAFVIDAGLSAGDMNSLLREATVRGVAKRQLELSQRINISGIAATTGIPRGEISRILKQKGARRALSRDNRQQSTNRILAAWHEEPRFTNTNGQPATLKIYGRGASFETLVRVHGRGIPPRAVLDELLRSHVVEVLPGQKIRARASVAVHRGLNPHLIKAFGDRASELLCTMLSNMRDPENPKFIATVAAPAATSKMLPLIRKELSDRSAEFLSEIRETLAVAARKRGPDVVGITVFYHEATRKTARPHSEQNRTNFRRRPIR